MAKNEGTLIIKEVRPYDSLDTYPSVHANEAKGGHHQVATLVERNAIPVARRLEGMFCFVAENGKLYKLESDLTTWTEFVGSSNHPDLSNLGYDSAGHTGFQRKLEYVVAYKAYLIGEPPSY